MTSRDLPGRSSHAEHLDNDTAEKGTTPPYEIWESDHTALVHVLWSAEYDGLIARRPNNDRPLRRAVFERLFGDRKHPYATGVIEDVRAILDAHDPAITPGAPGAGNVTGAERDSDPVDRLASALMTSRWFAAAKAEVVGRALREAADEEMNAQGGPTSSVERLLRRAHSHDGRG